MKKSIEIYKFKVELKYDKRTWRRIEIAASQTLDDLHEAIYRAFGRDDEHLYSFYFYDTPIPKSRDRVRNAVEYKHPMCFEDNYFDEEDCFDAAETKLSSLKLKVNRRFEYLFDFGDEWWHEITFEGAGEGDGGSYPRITEKHGDSPPQYPDEEEWDDEDEVEVTAIEIVAASTGKEPARKKAAVKKSVPKNREPEKKQAPVKKTAKAKKKTVKKAGADDRQPDLFG